MSLPDDYEVGYGRPPKHSQFVKGRSGNPRGRPSKQAHAISVGDIMDEQLRVRDSNGREHHMSADEIALKALVNRAFEGDMRAAAELIDLFIKYGLVSSEHRMKAGVIEVPKGIEIEIARLLVERYDRPPWSPKRIAWATALHEKMKSAGRAKGTGNDA